MPSIDVNAILLAELNAKNNQSYGIGDVSFTTLPSSDGLTTMRAVGSDAPIGMVVTNYHRINLADIGRPIRILPAPTVHELLGRITQKIGLVFSTEDIKDGGVALTDTSVTLVAEELSPAYRGSVTIPVTFMSTAISSLFTTLTISGTQKYATWQDMAATLATLNGVTILPQGVSFGTPSVYSGGGGNTQVMATGIDLYGYTGTVTVTYTRYDLATFGQKDVWSNDAYSGSTYDFLVKYLPEVAAVCSADDLVNTPLNIAAGASVAIAVNSATTSRNTIGSFQIQRHGINLDDYTINVAANMSVLYQDIGFALVPSVRMSVLYKA